MKPESILVYERVLNGELWPKNYVGTETTKDRSIEILRYLFFERLQIYDYDSLKAILNSKFIIDNKLGMVIKPFYRPPELLPDEFDHILWLFFPERKKGEQALIIKVYKDVLNGRRKTFPYRYFTDPIEGRNRARTCFKYLCRKILHLSGEKIAWEFSHSDGLKILSKYKLKVLTNHVYKSLSEMVEDTYPQYFELVDQCQRKRDKRRTENKQKELN